MENELVYIVIVADYYLDFCFKKCNSRENINEIMKIEIHECYDRKINILFLCVVSIIGHRKNKMFIFLS
jgi:hypothetical protein